MIIKMKVTGKSEFPNGANTTTNFNLMPINDSTATTQVNGSLNLTTTDQEFADKINFRDVLSVSIETVATTVIS